MLVRCIGTVGSGGVHHPPGSVLDLPASEIPRLVSLGVAEEMEQPLPPPPPPPTPAHVVVEVTAPPAGNGAPWDGEPDHQAADLLPAAPVPILPALSPVEPEPVARKKRRR